MTGKDWNNLLTVIFSIALIAMLFIV